MADIASLGIKVTTDGVQKAGADLDKLAASGDKAAKSTASLETTMKQSASSGASDTIAKGYKAQNVELSSLVSRINPAAGQIARSTGLMSVALTGATFAVGGTIAAIAGLAVAYVKGSGEATAFNKALILTGNAAGVTSGQLEGMVQSIGASSGRYGDARKAINALAASGKVAGEDLQRAGQAAVDMSRVTGQSIDEAMKQIIRLGDDPVTQIKKLNESYHFLTAAQYTQIKALQDEGHERQAASLAEQIYAQNMHERALEVEKNAGLMERAGHSVAEAWDKAWDSITGVGRDTQINTQIAKLQAKLDALQKPSVATSSNPVASARGIDMQTQGVSDKNRQAQIAAVKAQIFALRGKQVQAALAASASEDAAQANQDAIAARDRLDKFASAGDVHDKALKKAAIDRTRALYGVVDPAERAKIEAEFKEQVKQADAAYKAPKGRAIRAPRAAQDFSLRDAALINKEIAAEGKLQDVRIRGEETVKAYRATLADMLQTRQATIDLQVQSIGMGQKEAQQQAALIAIDEDYNRKKAGLEKQQRDTGSEIQKGYYQQQLDDLAKYHDERVRIEVDGARRADAARASFGNGAAAALADFKDSAADVAGQSYRLFSNAFDGMADSITQFVTTGKGSFSDLAKSIIADLIKIQTRILLSQALSSMFGGMSSGQQASLSAGAGSFVDSIYNAKGNVYNSPSLSAYSNTIVDKPTYFARGGNVMGEAGPEAIMPLTRGPNGKLGVQSAGGGGMEVEINITNTGNDMQARQTGARSDGKKMMIDLILETVSSDMAGGGKTAKAAQQRFGLARRGVPVAG